MRKLNLVLLLGVLIFLSGCFGPNPYDPGIDDPIPSEPEPDDPIPSEPEPVPDPEPEPEPRPEPIPVPEPREGQLKIMGTLVDTLSSEPIDGAKLASGYLFYPEEVYTDENGNFEFLITEESGTSFVFSNRCNGYSSQIVLQDGMEVWEDSR